MVISKDINSSGIEDKISQLFLLVNDYSGPHSAVTGVFLPEIWLNQAIQLAEKYNIKLDRDQLEKSQYQAYNSGIGAYFLEIEHTLRQDKLTDANIRNLESCLYKIDEYSGFIKEDHKFRIIDVLISCAIYHQEENHRNESEFCINRAKKYARDNKLNIEDRLPRDSRYPITL